MSSQTDYSKMTAQDFENTLERLVQERGASALMAVAGVWECVAEEWNNDVLDAWKEEQSQASLPLQSTLKELTQYQRDILKVLLSRRDELTAEMAERTWRAGLRFTFDTRGASYKGLVFKLEKANLQAEERNDDE